MARRDWSRLARLVELPESTDRAVIVEAVVARISCLELQVAAASGELGVLVDALAFHDDTPARDSSIADSSSAGAGPWWRVFGGGRS